MLKIVQFPSSTELGIQYTASPVPLSETDAIVLSPLNVDGTVVAEAGGNTQATLYIKYVKGTSTSATLRVYGSYLDSPGINDWYKETVETDAAGVATLDPFSIVLTADAVIAYHFPIGAFKTLKVTVVRAGVDGSSSIILNLGLRTN